MIQMITTTLEKNPNTKTTYITVSEETKNISFEQYENITNKDTLQWFRRLGGSETVIRNYTKKGLKIVKLVSTSPDKETKKVRTFKFL